MAKNAVSGVHRLIEPVCGIIMFQIHSLQNKIKNNIACDDDDRVKRLYNQ